MNRFNTWLAVKITDGVSTMACAYVFAVIALISLPAAISSHSLIVIVAWVAQTFLQLVLLSVIMVGQKLQADTTIKHLTKHHKEHMGELDKIKKHLGIYK
jgi:hypothetical protein